MTTELRHYWHPVATSGEVTASPLPVVLLDEELVLFRDVRGVAALRDLCIHRGTRLSLGRVTEQGVLECPYHGWSYDRTGACVRIPSRPPGSSIPGAARAQAFEVAEAHGLVWVALGEPCAEVPGAPGGEWGDPSFRTFVVPAVEWRASAGRVVENFIDISHLPFVHQGLLGSQELVDRYEVVRTPAGLAFSLSEMDPGAVDEQEGQVVREYSVTMPFTAHVATRSSNGQARLMSIMVCPVSAKVSRLFFAMSRNYELDPAHDGKYVDYHKTVMLQDQQIVESQQPEEIPLDLREELHLKVPDAAGMTYRRLLADIDAGQA